jgi:carbamate kinase
LGHAEPEGDQQVQPRVDRQYSFLAGSMGPKVDAACQFARATGKAAAIGSLADIPDIVKHEPGTIISSSYQDISWH